MSSIPIRLVEARPSDVAAIMALERGPGFAALVGRSSADEHRALMASANHVYLIADAPPGGPLAFAILRDLADPNGNCYLKRVAVARPGQGIGATFLALVADWVFARPSVHRFWLDCFSDNVRAQRAYEKLGFSRDGVLRQAYRLPDGRRKDLTLMALTRPEWEGRALTA